MDRGQGPRTVLSTTATVRFTPSDDATCTHRDAVRTVVPDAPGCSNCTALGSTWIHLRICMTCGHVGCCDDSPHRHARAHFDRSGHPIMRSAEPGETWGWCFIDAVILLAHRGS